MRSDLIATVSHELRTPLAAVYGAAATLRRKADAFDEAGREQLLEMMETQAARLGTILEEILLASRLDSGTLRLAAEPADPLALAEEVVGALRAAHPDAQLSVAAPDELPTVTLDTEKAAQVLRNLVDNAIRYGGHGPVEVGVEAGDGRIRFSVRDEGVGIPEAEQNRIFQKFYRVRTSSAVTGTGLGLYICRELVEHMGGELSVESAPGEGSTFSFELPL